MAAQKGKAAESEAPAKGGKTKLLVLVGAALVLLGGGAAGAWFMGLLGGRSEAAASAGHGEAAATVQRAEQSKEPNPPPVPQVAFVDLPDILVNLKSTNKRPRFLKLKVALEVKDGRVADQVKQLIPRIMDGFQLYLRALDADEIQGSEGMLTLKEELLVRINQSIAPARVTDVLFKEMLVQ